MRRQASVCLLALLLVFGTSARVRGSDWRTVYHHTFEQNTLENAWKASGNWSVSEGKLSIVAGPKGMLRLNQTWGEPAIRVSVECWFTSETVSDVSVILGLGIDGKSETSRFTLGADHNRGTRLAVPARPAVFVDAFRLEPEKHYKLVAESNGTVMTLYVDGRVIARRKTLLPLEPGQIALSVGQGTVHFTNLTVQTKATADTAQAIQIQDKLRQTQEKTGYIPPIWGPSSLKTKKKSSRVRKRLVPLLAQSVVAMDQPYPVTFGVPLPRRQLFDAAQVRLLDSQGREIPAQITPTATWGPQDSLKWVLVDTQLSFSEIAEPTELMLEYGRRTKRQAVADPVVVTQDAQMVTVDTGRLKVLFSRSRGTLIDAAWLDGKSVMTPTPKRGGFFVDNQGRTYRTSGRDEDYKLTVELAGPLRVVIRAEGWYINENGEKACRYLTRIHLYRGQAMVQIDHTWIVTVDTDQMWFRELGIALPMSLGKASASAFGTDRKDLSKHREVALVKGKPVFLTQDKQAHFMLGQEHARAFEGEQAAGWASLLGEQVGATLTVRDMALQFPNALEVASDGMTFYAWSAQGGGALDFRHDAIKRLWGQATWDRMNQQATESGPFASRVSNGLGFARTHHLTLNFHAPQVKAALRCGTLGQEPPLAMAEPKWNCKTGVLAFDVPPYDEDKFVDLENQIRQQFDRYVSVATHLEPMVGFWDYGRGCPRDLVPVNKGKSNELWTFSGINANDDMSYGNAEVPWLLYFRSGERRYFQRAMAMTTQVMDARILHWYSKNLGREIGQSYNRTGSWVFDGNGVGWNGNVWPGFLSTAFLMTGDQRPLDVLGEIVRGYQHTSDKPLTNAAVSYIGAMANYHRLTWDPSLRKEIEEQSPVFLQRQRATGFWPEQDLSYEYTLGELLLEPNPKPTWVNVATTFARGAIGPMRFHTTWSIAAGIQAWSWKREPDPRFGVNAKAVLENPVPTLTGPENLAPLRSTLIWMGLRDVPGTEDVLVPRVITYARPQESTFYLKHEQGRQTHIELHCSQVELTITDTANKPIASNLLRSQRKIGIYEITIPASKPSMQYRLAFKLPTMYETNEGGTLGRSLPWRPGDHELLLVLHGPTLFVQDVSNGKLTHGKGPAWFFVPKRTEALTVHVARTHPNANQIQLVLPNGQIKTFESDKATLKLNAKWTGKVWSVRSSQPYFELENTSLSRETLRPHYLKLIGVPTFVAPRKESLFRPIAASEQRPEKSVIAHVAFPRGRFRRGVRLQGGSSYVRIPTGTPTEDPTIRDYFNARQGTIEMFIRFGRSTIAGGYGSMLLSLQNEGDPTFMMTVQTGTHWQGVFRSGGGQLRQVALTDRFCSPQISAGRWYHLAIQWNTNDNGKVMRRIYLDGYPYAYGDAFGRYDPTNWWPPAMEPGQPGPYLFLGGLEQAPRKGHTSCVVDEFRISDIPRYPFMPGPPKVGGRRAFIPPAEPFEVDVHTNALFHFEGNTIGLDREGNPINATRIAVKVKQTLKP